MRVAVLATGVGMAARVCHGEFSGINPFLFHLGWLHEAASRGDQIAVAAMAVLAIIAFIRPYALILAAFSALILLEILARQEVGGYAYSEWTIISESLRYMSPIALTLIACRWTASRYSAWLAAAWMLRISIALVFFAHGWAAFHQNPMFIDMLIASADNLLGMRLRQANAEAILMLIGMMDMTIAALVLIRPWKIVLRFAAAWGLFTAFSRMPSFGWIAYGEFLVRASHALAPLALIYLILSIRLEKPNRQPDRRDKTT